MKNNWESRMSYWRSCALAIVLMGVASISARAQNSIQSVNSSLQAGSEVVRIELAEPLSAVPAGFTIQTPPRIAIDLPGVGNAMGKSSVEVNQGNLRSVNVAQAGERTRLVLNLKQPANYRAELQGKMLVLVLDSSAPLVAQEHAGTEHALRREPQRHSASAEGHRFPARCGWRGTRGRRSGQQPDRRGYPSTGPEPRCRIPALEPSRQPCGDDSMSRISGRRFKR